MTTAVKERPILFSGPMVRAILAGRKTQTRRSIKPAPPSIELIRKMSGSSFGLFTDGSTPPGVFRVSGPVWAVRDSGSQTQWKCPYGEAGDRLWVRETVAFGTCNKGLSCIQYAADQAWHHLLAEDEGEGDLCGVAEPCRHGVHTVGVKKPSIFMRRWACRILVEITSIRAERLNDISEADAMAEGMHEFKLPNGSIFGHDPKGTPGKDVCSSAVGSFAKLWGTINGPGSYEANPWVWVVTFKRLA